MNATSALPAALAALLLSVGCDRGPEGSGGNAGEPDAVPWTERAMKPRAAAATDCVDNRSDVTVTISAAAPGDPPGSGFSAPLAPSRRLILPKGASAVSFASLPDGREPGQRAEIRSRWYLLIPRPGADGFSGCSWQIRSDPRGRLDLFASGQ